MTTTATSTTITKTQSSRRIFRFHLGFHGNFLGQTPSKWFPFFDYFFLFWFDNALCIKNCNRWFSPELSTISSLRTRVRKNNRFEMVYSTYWFIFHNIELAIGFIAFLHSSHFPPKCEKRSWNNKNCACIARAKYFLLLQRNWNSFHFCVMKWFPTSFS